MMKKHLLYSMVATAGLALAGCNGDYKDWEAPQSYAPEAASAAYGVTFAAGPQASFAMPVAESDLKIVTLTASASDVTGYTLKHLTVNGVEMGGSVSDNNIIVKANDLLNAAEKIYNSRAAVARTLEVTS